MNKKIVSMILESILVGLRFSFFTLIICLICYIFNSNQPLLALEFYLYPNLWLPLIGSFILGCAGNLLGIQFFKLSDKMCDIIAKLFSKKIDALEKMEEEDDKNEKRD